MVQPYIMAGQFPTNDEIIAAIQREPLLAELSHKRQIAMADLVGVVAEFQQSLNLTAIRDPLAMVRYHLADSLALIPALKISRKEQPLTLAVDIGTGGGFPLLPMAIVRPDTHWTGIESVQKKAAAVEQIARYLALSNVELRPERAEDVGRGELRGSADIVTARAVGPTASLLEVGIPLLRVGGQILLFKTESARDEWDRCAPVLKWLGAEPAGEYQYSLDGDEQSRLILIATKTAETQDTYPRSAGVTFKKPFA
jgi:16S rRNA (guanine527-N7)-methyltransferase